MTVKFTNNASSTVATGINSSATSLTVASASAFPQLAGADDYCYLTIQQSTGIVREVVKATALSSNTFTIVRAQDGTSAGTWSAGDIVELRMTAALLTDVIDAATVEGVKTNFQYTPTAGQTAFSGADNASNTMIINQAALVSVYMNGVRLVQGTDYNVSSANNTVTLTVGATTADIIDIEVFGNFTGQSGAAVAITGGAISGASVAATTLSASGTATLNTFVSNNITVSGGSINNVNIGATTAGTGRFSSITTTGSVTATAASFVKASSGGSATSGTVLTVEDDDNTEFSILGGSSSVLAINFGHSGDNDEGKITFNTTAGSEDLQLVSSKEITLDAAGDISLDADGGDIRLLDGGTQFGKFTRDGGDFLISSSENDKHMKFAGADGGANITALDLDMENGGIATFNSGINIGNRGSASDPTLQSAIDPDTGIFWGGGDILGFSSGGSEAMRISGGNATFSGTISSGAITSSGNVTATNTGGLGIQTSGYSLLSAANNARAASGSLRLGNGAGSTGLVLDYTDQGQTVATIRNMYVASTSSELTIQSPFITFDTGTSYTQALLLDHNQNATFSGTLTTNGLTRINSVSGNSQSALLDLYGTNGGGFGGSSIARSRVESVTAGGPYNADMKFYTTDDSNNLDLALTLDHDQNATFSGSVTASTSMVVGDGEAYGFGDNSYRIEGKDDGTNARIGFVTGGSEAMRINTDQKILIGDSDSHTTDLLQIETPASGGGHGIQIRRNDSNTSQGVGHILFGNNTAIDLAKIAAGTDGATDAGYLILATQPTGGNLTDRLTISSTGNATFSGLVGINKQINAAVGLSVGADATATNSYALEVCNSNANTRFLVDGVGSSFFYNINNSLGMKFDASSGNLGLGAVPISLDGNAAPGMTISSNGPFICLQDANNADKVNYIANNTGVMQFGIVGDNGATGKTEVANFSSAGAVFNENHEAGLDFRVESDTNSNMFHIDSSINCVGIGRAATSSVLTYIDAPATHHAMVARCATSGFASIVFDNTDGSGTRYFASFRINNTEVGKITSTGSLTNYGTSSDARLKDNIQDADDAGSKIDAIQVRQFDWKLDGKHQDYGMIAQELQSVAPDAVQEPEDPDEMMGVDYSKLVPMLIKEIQSLRSRVAELENN